MNNNCYPSSTNELRHSIPLESMSKSTWLTFHLPHTRTARTRHTFSTHQRMWKLCRRIKPQNASVVSWDMFSKVVGTMHTASDHIRPRVASSHTGWKNTAPHRHPLPSHSSALTSNYILSGLSNYHLSLHRYLIAILPGMDPQLGLWGCKPTTLFVKLLHQSPTTITPS